MAIISGLALFFYIIVLAVIIATAFLEAILVKRKKKKSAIALILIVFVLMTLSSFSYTTTEPAAVENGGVVFDLDDDNDPNGRGEFDYIADENGNVLGFSYLKITSGDSPKYLKLEFNDEGELVGEEEALQYRDDIISVLSDKTFRGSSMDKEEFDAVSQGGVTKSDNKFLIEVFFINNIWTVILIVVYIIFTYRNSKKKKSSIDSVKIQDL